MAERRICSISDCGKPLYARGWCTNHYQQERYHKRLVVKLAPAGAGVKFCDEALGSDTDECIVWPYGGSSNPDKYPMIRVGGKNLLGHRYVCRMAHGDPPSSDSYACHSCANRKCVNPRHLRWADHAANMNDKAIHGSVKGEKSPRAKLTESDVLFIRAHPEISPNKLGL